MIWLILGMLFFLVLVGIIAVSVKGRVELESRADLDSLKRTDPDHPLATVSQAEYDRAIAELRNAKSKEGCLPLIAMLAAILIVGPLIAWIAYDAIESGFVALLAWVIPSSAGMFYFFKAGGRATSKPTNDEIAKQLGL